MPCLVAWIPDFAVGANQFGTFHTGQVRNQLAEVAHDQLKATLRYSSDAARWDEKRQALVERVLDRNLLGRDSQRCQSRCSTLGHSEGIGKIRPDSNSYQ